MWLVRDGGGAIILPSTVALDLTVLVLEGEAGTLTVTIGVGRGGLGTCQAQAGDGGQDQDHQQGGQHGCVHHEKRCSVLTGVYACWKDFIW